ncbi:NAD-dependent epimerase/dehydratase family protein [Leptothermofonsia sichuanensis E412]|uniref:NAD-dependent epimerase/dehydratase family protein n=1 Tax=Leptothermofonsia sichuanensis TaxID=2917832 RepID=UPI001CA5F4B7|nr:NAD-dependent epimerase/dehydratase family protein [Leptothermofonsia sichuanensis]QZZ22103.1 NAD-dependent epimerase/dehydratase family protein [Leptothermofonsia sichuanensis E412]
MKFLVTGGAGFIGKWLIEKLPANAEVVVIDSLDAQVHRTSQDFSPELKARAKCIQVDVQDIERHREAVEGTDVVIHLASQTGTGQSMYEISRYVQHNANGTARLLELISSLEQKPQRIILSSSRAVYGDGAYTDGNRVYYPKGRRLEDLQKGIWEVCSENGEPLKPLPMEESHLPKPTSVYGLTKLWQEQLLQNYCENQGIDLVTLRFQNVYGPKQELGNPYTGIIGIFTNAIVQGNSLEVFEDGQMTRDFVFVEDVVDAVVRCATHQETLSAVINVGTGQAVTLLDVIHAIAELVDKSVNYTISGRFRVGDIRHAVADMSAYERLFGSWKPTPLKAGLAQYLEWYLGQKPLSPAVLQASLKEMERTGLLLTKQS